MSENLFKQTAKQSLGGSPVMRDRVKMRTEEIIANYPEGVTITEFDFITNGEGKMYPVFAFSESPEQFFNGGAIAAKIAGSWVGMYDGDVHGASDALKASGGVKVKLELGKTKKGKSITLFTVVD